MTVSASGVAAPERPDDSRAAPTPAPAAPPVRRGACVALVLASVGLYVLSFPPFGASWLAFVALAPYFALHEAIPGRAWYRWSLAYGVLFFGAGFHWVAVPHPVLVVPTALILGLWFLPYAAAHRFLVRRTRIAYVPGVAALWVLFEWARSHGPIGVPWLLLGHTRAADVRLLQTADALGEWGLSFLVALPNALVARALVDRWLRRDRTPWRAYAAARIAPALLGIGALAAAGVAYGEGRLREARFAHGPAVVVVQGNIASSLKGDPANAEDLVVPHLRLTGEALRRAPDAALVVWPESVLQWHLEPGLDVGGLTPDDADEAEAMAAIESEWLDAIASVAGRGGRTVLVGAVHWGVLDGALSPAHNSVLALSVANDMGTAPRARVVGRYDKVRLVPFAERVPLAGAAFMRPVERGVRATLGVPFPHLERGGGPRTLVVDAGPRRVRAAMGVCFEVAFARHFRAAWRDGRPDVLVVATNYGWFSGTGQQRQADALARFRAVENRATVVVAANTGISAFYAPDGRRYAGVGSGGRLEGVEGAVSAPLALDARVPPYVRLGDAFVALLLAGLVVAQLAPASGRRARAGAA